MKSKKLCLPLLFVLCLLLGSCGSPSSSGSFDDYNILTFALVEDSRETEEVGDMTIHRESWRVTNPTDDVLSDVTFTVSFCDENGTIVHTDTRTLGVSLAAGQSFEQLVYTEKEYETSSVTVYGFSLGGNKSVQVDVVAETYTFL